jgi:hypothetical protein
MFLARNPRETTDWLAPAVNLLHGAIETDEKKSADLAGLGYHINRSNQLVLESKADMQKRGQASPDDGDALALTFAQPWTSAEVEEMNAEFSCATSGRHPAVGFQIHGSRSSSIAAGAPFPGTKRYS